MINICFIIVRTDRPGSPSLVGRKPGNSYSKLVILMGLEGSNPSPGAYFKISQSAKEYT